MTKQEILKQISELLTALATVDTAEVASEIDYDQLKEQIDYKKLMRAADISAYDIAQEYPSSDIASDIDLSDLASEFNESDIAKYVEVDASEVAENLNYELLAKSLLKELAVKPAV